MSNILNEEFTFLFNLFAEPDEAEQALAQKTEQEEDEADMFDSTKLTAVGGNSCIETTPSGPNSNCMTDNTSTYFEGERVESAQPLYAWKPI